MGLLDDAIREHLELQRRRGADPTEVARAEQEALGPVRREPVATSASVDDLAETHHHEQHDDEPGLAPEERLQASGYASEAAPVREDEDPRAEPHEAPVPRRNPDTPVRDTWDSDPEPPTRALDATGRALEAERRAAPRERPGPAPAPAPAPADEPTTEHRVADDAPARGAEPEEDEDVLEETPDFLQETPEHDRLWFEQRPPRDFDFDG